MKWFFLFVGCGCFAWAAWRLGLCEVGLGTRLLAGGAVLSWALAGWCGWCDVMLARRRAARKASRREVDIHV